MSRKDFGPIFFLFSRWIGPFYEIDYFANQLTGVGARDAYASKQNLDSLSSYIVHSMTRTKFYKLSLLAVVIKGSVAFHILQHFTTSLFFYCSFAKSVENLIWQPENHKFYKNGNKLQIV